MVQQSRIEQTIISSLFYREDYTRKVLPFIKEEYFGNRVEQLLYGEIFKFVEKYNNLPTKDAILIELNSRKDINEEELNHLKDYVNGILGINKYHAVFNNFIKDDAKYIEVFLKYKVIW